MRNDNSAERICRVLINLVVGFLMIFAPLSFGVVNYLPFYICHIAVMILVFLWILKMVVSGRIKLLKPLILLPIALFVAYAGGYLFFSDIYYYSRHEFLVIVDYALFFLVVINTFQRKRYVYGVFFTIITIGVLISSIGVIQYLKKLEVIPGIGLKHEIVQGDTDAVDDKTVHTTFSIITKEKPAQYINRASGSFVCPNHMAGYLELIFPVALAIIIFSRFVIGVRLVVAYSLAVMLGAWILSFSRGGWIAGMCSIIAFTIFSFSREDTRGNAKLFLPVTLLIILLVLIGAFVKPVQERLLTIRPYGDKSIGTRMDIWADTIEMIKQKPIFGYGPHAFVWRYPPFKHEKLTRKVTYTHNDYLNTLVDYGAVGFIIVALFFLILLSNIKKLPDLYDFPDNQTLLIGGLAAMVAVLAHALFDFNSHIYSNALLMVFIAAVIVAMSYSVEEAHEAFWKFKFINKNKIVFYVVSLILIVVSGLGVLHASKLFLSQLYLEQGRAFNTEILWNKAMEKFEEAERLDPYNPNIYSEMAAVVSAQNVFRKTDNSRAIELYEQAIQLNPYESDYHFKLAQIYKRNGDFEHSKTLLDQAIAQEPLNKAYQKEHKKIERLLQR